jgi:hypothetical protein
MIVKIFSHSDPTMSGSGFIVGSHLFTAAHLFFHEEKIESPHNYYFAYNGSKIEFSKTNLIHLEHKKISEYSGKDTLFEDLAIFDISNFEPLKNNLKFYGEQIQSKMPIITQGFSNLGETFNEFKSNTILHEFSFMGVGKNNGVGKFSNCFKIDQIVNSGNSGGPAFFENRIAGMIVSSNEGNKLIQGTTLLKAEYILKKLG